MPNPCRIIEDNATLRRDYNRLTEGDIVVGRISMQPSEQPLVVDLLERGVVLIPAGTAQLASRSKTFQVRLYPDLMLPHTLAVHSRHELLAAINLYAAEDIGRVITKHDRKNAGLGIHLWSSIEDVYNHIATESLELPFVLQPFIPGLRDLRVVILDDYVEAYERSNPHSFRNNLHVGGRSHPRELDSGQLALCRRAMARGRFPYAHLDLAITPDGASYLGEINLRGGLRGASLSGEDYQQRIDAIHRRLLAGLTGGGP